MQPVFLNPNIKHFTPAPSFQEDLPIYPYLVKAVAVLPQMIQENRRNQAVYSVSDPSNLIHLFLEGFKRNALEALLNKPNASIELIRQTCSLITSSIEPLQSLRYSNLKELDLL